MRAETNEQTRDRAPGRPMRANRLGPAQPTPSPCLGPISPSRPKSNSPLRFHGRFFVLFALSSGVAATRDPASGRAGRQVPPAAEESGCAQTQGGPETRPLSAFSDIQQVDLKAALKV